MVRIEKRDYTEEDVLKVLKFINKRDGEIKLNTILFNLGPEISEKIESAVQSLVEENVIGSRDSFLKAHINYSPYDTIIYDGIADNYIGVKKNNNLYLKNKSRDEFKIKPIQEIKS